MKQYRKIDLYYSDPTATSRGERPTFKYVASTTQSPSLKAAKEAFYRASVPNGPGRDFQRIKASWGEPKRNPTRRKNPARPTSKKWAICIRKPSGPTLCWDGERFSNNQAPKLYQQNTARAIGRQLMNDFPRSFGGYVMSINDTPPLKKNPDPRAGLDAAADRLERFSGHKAAHVMRVQERGMKTGLVIGKLDGVLYTATRDGKRERYIHEFRNKSRPLLAASSDGTQLRIVGGQFEFTEAGIEDR